MRLSIVLACLSSCLMAGLTLAQCPPTYRSRCSVIQSQACYPTYPQPAYTVAVAHVPNSHCPTYSQARPLHNINPVMGSRAVVQGICSSPTRYMPVGPPPALARVQPLSVAPTTAQPSPPSQVPSNCSCKSGSASPQAAPHSYPPPAPQATSILEKERNPFSLAGHSRPSADRAVNHCLQEFERCCENGGKDCMLNYFNCTQITGEPLRHSYCPGPATDGRSLSNDPK